MTTIDVIISTCNERLLNLSKMELRAYPNVRYLVIYQVFHDSLLGDAYLEKSPIKEQLEHTISELSKRPDIHIHTVFEKGLSKSRNTGLLKSTADICLLSDDDVIYLEGAIPKIIEIFEQYPQEDIITFKMRTASGEPIRTYVSSHSQGVVKMTGFYDSVIFWSAEIAFRRASILEGNIAFNETIGAGTAFPVGEETLFLADCYQHNLSIALAGVSICIFPDFSTGDREDFPMYFIRGVVWAKIFGISATFYQIRKHLIDHLTPKSGLKLIGYLAGNIYYLVRGRTLLS